MSIKLVAAVLDGSLPPTDTLILIALADFANEHGICWPAKETIARRARIAKRTVDRRVEKLEKQGWLTVKTVAGGRVANTYQLNVERIMIEGSNHVKLTPHPCHHSDTPGVSSIVTPEPSYNHHRTLPAQEPPAMSAQAWFAKWWRYAFEQKTGSKYVFTQKAGGIIANLIANLDLVDLTARACAYLTLHPADRFPSGAATLEGLQAMINQLAGKCDDRTIDDCIAAGLLPDGMLTTTFQPWAD